jgi:hypothetical protein
MVNYTRAPFNQYPSLVKALESNGGRVFAHTNRSLLNQDHTSQYSMHLIKKSCRPTQVFSELYPASICLSNATTYFSNRQRDLIVSDVKKRVRECDDFSGVRRTVYGGLCGVLEDFDMSDACIRELRSEYEWKSAYFPATFPNEDRYESWRLEDCPKGTNPLKGSFWEKSLNLKSWHYVESGHPSPTNIGVPFTTADWVLMLGSYDPKVTSQGRGLPQWVVYVNNPR